MDLNEYKYEAKVVRAKISSDKGKYPDILRLRYVKGQQHPEPWSIQILGEVDVIPKEFL